ncbi:MAG: SDR family NAD(P)-dependent oxidoreductase [Caldithrix sp.]|nr:SDR family NAD(P)-dependent oxidoreductase [Caldithrix sp.]
MDFAVITGAGSGIGQALAVELAREKNIKILGVGRRLQTLQETKIQFPERIHILKADVSTVEGRKKIVNALPDGVSVKFLIHNAGTLQPVVPLAEMKLEDWQQHMSTNVEGPLFLTKALLPKLENGRILHISSGAAHKPYPGWGAYCTSKTALFMIYQILRQELAEKNISVGSLRPGVVDTPMQDEVRASDENAFPALPKFIQYKKEGKLFSPIRVARFIIQLLYELDKDTYSGKEWDIREHEQELNNYKNL